MSKVQTVINRVNVVRMLLDNVLGENHSHRHRMGFGFILMTIGVMIAKSFAGVEYEIVHMVCDCVGYFIHGLGCVPFVDYACHRFNGNNNP